MNCKIFLIFLALFFVSCGINHLIKSTNFEKKDIDDRPFLGYNETHGEKSVLTDGENDYRNKVWDWEARFKNKE